MDDVNRIVTVFREYGEDLVETVTEVWRARASVFGTFTAMTEVMSCPLFELLSSFRFLTKA